jgi:hypothetical protein
MSSSSLTNYIYPKCSKRIEMYSDMNEVNDCSQKIGNMYGIIIAIILCIIAYFIYSNGNSNYALLFILCAVGAYFGMPKLMQFTMSNQWTIADEKIRSMMPSDIKQLEYSDPERYKDERLNYAQKIIGIDQQDEIINAQNRIAHSSEINAFNNIANIANSPYIHNLHFGKH